jgi:hypothetical protein
MGSSCSCSSEDPDAVKQIKIDNLADAVEVYDYASDSDERGKNKDGNGNRNRNGNGNGSMNKSGMSKYAISAENDTPNDDNDNDNYNSYNINTLNSMEGNDNRDTEDVIDTENTSKQLSMNALLAKYKKQDDAHLRPVHSSIAFNDSQQTLTHNSPGTFFIVCVYESIGMEISKWTWVCVCVQISCIRFRLPS